jgi:predicted methyltransferase
MTMMMKSKITLPMLALLMVATPAMAAHHEAASEAHEATQPLVVGVPSTSPSPSLEAVIAGDHRSDKNKARDGSRHPLETLNFFGLKPNMTVVEIWPGGGWYMDIVAPVVATEGAYYAVGFDRSSQSDYIKKATKAMVEKVEANQALFGRVVITELSNTKLDIAPPGSADMVLTFRNVHNWVDGTGHEAKVFAAMFKALKPGGILGLVEHRLAADTDQDATASSGYVRQDFVIKLAEEAGFQLVDSAEINANSNDTKDHPGGVWTLPPSLAKGDENKDKYLAIGESDRMTLKFVKPRVGGMASIVE